MFYLCSVQLTTYIDYSIVHVKSISAMFFFKYCFSFFSHHHLLNDIMGKIKTCSAHALLLVISF